MHAANMDERKSKTLFVRNLPFSATNETLSEIFGEIGPIKTAFVVKEKGADQCKGYGYVKFSMIEDAVKAKETVKSIDGRKVFTSYADAKKSRNPPKATDIAEGKAAKVMEEKTKTAKEGKAKSITAEKAKSAVEGKPQSMKQEKAKTNVKEKTKSAVERGAKSVLQGDAKHGSRENTKGRNQAKKAKHIEKVGQEGKQASAKDSGKRCRMIVRNLSFKCETKDLRAAFEKFGELTDVNVPTKKDGKKCGFGFVQFDKLSSAEAAIAEMNAKEILGRPVAVDWAVPKDQYVKSEVQQKKDNAADVEESHKEEKSEDEDEKAESDESLSMNDESDAEENPDVESMEPDIEEEDDNDTDDDDDDTDDDDDDDDDTDDDDGHGDEEEEGDEGDEGFEEESSSNGSDVDEKQKVAAKDKKKKDEKLSRKSDVNEGRTLFVRNVPFDADEEDLVEVFQEFGELAYTRLVLDPLTEHPKGTAFVQFRSKEAAERCLEKVQDGDTVTQSPGLMCNGRRLLVTLAISRSEAQAQTTAKKQKEKTDSRNLFLACEGMIRPGTKAAEGISPEDMAKRMKIEQLKRERLKNQNIFVSSTRLCVHNLPTHVDDKTLRKTLLDVLGDSSARITECRVMRDMARKNAKSLGFAFINFTKHEHALAALRKTNNNPAIFGDKKRPIVEFSLENRKALEAKQRRIEKGRLKQERRDLKRAASEGIQNISSEGLPPGKKTKMSARSFSGASKAGKNKEQDNIAKQQHTGPRSLPKHFGPKLRHRDRKKRAEQKAKAKKKNPVKMVAPKQPSALPKKKKNQTDSFDKLVASYKQKFLKGARTKWCD